jgi:hypothetical protein
MPTGLICPLVSEYTQYLYISLPYSAADNPAPGQRSKSQLSVEVEGLEEWEVEDVLYSC